MSTRLRSANLRLPLTYLCKERETRVNLVSPLLRSLSQCSYRSFEPDPERWDSFQQALLCLSSHTGRMPCVAVVLEPGTELKLLKLLALLPKMRYRACTRSCVFRVLASPHRIKSIAFSGYISGSATLIITLTWPRTAFALQSAVETFTESRYARAADYCTCLHLQQVSLVDGFGKLTNLTYDVVHGQASL
jgi:hypothetical protein